MAESVRPIFTEVIVAPDYDPQALELLQTKKKNLRISRSLSRQKSKTSSARSTEVCWCSPRISIDASGDDPDAWKLVSGELADAETTAIWSSHGEPFVASSRTPF